MDRMESIKLALMNEETEMNFYLSNAQRSENPLAISIFEHLARDEAEHMVRIRRLADTLVEDGKWPEDIPLHVDGTDIRETLMSLVGKKGSDEGKSEDDVTALKKAVEFEGKGEKFYADLAEACNAPQEKNFFKFLSTIEREHRLSLIDTLAYLEDPETWMEEHEKIGLDGA